jgi:hypothetical protein
MVIKTLKTLHKINESYIKSKYKPVEFHFTFNFICMFICSLFNNTFSVTQDYIASDEMIYEWWIRKDVDGRDRGLISGTIPALAWKDRKKKHEKTASR